MGKHSYTTSHASDDDDELYERLPGCSMWELFHWRSYFRKMINPKYVPANGVPLTCNNRHWTPEISHRISTTSESAEELFDAKETYTPHKNSKRSRTSKKRSIKARIKSLIAEDFYKEVRTKQHQEELCSEPSLRRTYSIHQLESLHDEINKICTDWRHEAGFISRKVNDDPAGDSLSKLETDDSEARNKHSSDGILEIFKVDKQMFIRELRQSSEKLSNFMSGQDVAPMPLTSRSFPVDNMSPSTVLKPSKLGNKQTEVWASQKSNATAIKKRIQRRSLSLNDTLGMYTWLFDNTYEMDTKLQPSKSLKLDNDDGQGLTNYRRIRSLPSGDPYFSNLKFSVMGNDFSLKGSFDQKDDTVVNHMWYKDNGTSENISDVERNINEVERSDPYRAESKGMFSEISMNKQPHAPSMLSVDLAPHSEQHQFSQSVENRSNPSGEELSFPLSYDDDQERLLNHLPAYYNSSFNIKKDEKLHKTLETTKRNSDLNFVRHLLDQSGLAMPDSEILDQPLSSQLFEKVEACWPHDEDELTGLPDFDGCWHHMMLFHLVNEMLADVYDVSLPYYPKPLSSRCHIHPFASGNYIINEVSTKVSKLVDSNFEPHDYAFCCDLASDSSWMNLQFESECTALELEDMIFDEILDEFIYLYGLQVF